MNPRLPSESPLKTLQRVRFLYTVIAVVIGIFFVRLFYLQIIRHDFYRKSAMSDQLKEYEIPAARGIIKAHEGEAIVPIVLNEKLFTVYADPSLVKKNIDKVATSLAASLKLDEKDVRVKITSKGTRYVILAKKVTPGVKDEILKHKFPGIGAQQQSYRTYPNGSLAGQTLGFVNNDGDGVYGIEQALQSTLGGTDGQLKAVTDVNGIPLAANTENTLLQPQNGSDVVLTLEMPMQKQLENILQQGLKDAKSDSGSAIIMDMTGGIKAIANWPTYDPGNYGQAENNDVFTNPAVSDALEVGSIMKPLTMAAALDHGAVQKSTTYYDPAVWTVDDFKITNIEEDGGAGTQSMSTLLNLSLNTGATWLLMRMGGSDDKITQSGREVWHDYMVNHYRFGRETGVEQGYESAGIVPDPNKGYGRDLTYANTSFGQGMSATMLQMAAAYTAVLNGGNYYQPRLVDQTINTEGVVKQHTPKLIKKDVVSPQVSQDTQELMEYVIAHRTFKPAFNLNTYSVGGKTGTAEIAKPEGGYYKDDFNGTYAGFVGGNDPQYVIVVCVNKPKNGGYAGTAAAQPIFGKLAHMLIDTYNVAPKH